jgi:hypothetical protein
LLHTFLLFLGKSAEKLDLLLIGWLPLIIHLESALKVLLHLYIEGLWLHIDERWVIDTWDGLCWNQMMQITCQFCKFGTRCLLLAFLFLEWHLALILWQLLSNFFILGLNMIEVGLPGIEVMLVLSWVIATVTKTNKKRLGVIIMDFYNMKNSSITNQTCNLLFLYDFSHFMIEGHLLWLTNLLPLAEKDHPSLVIASVDPLDESATFQNGVVIPFDFKHSPVLLDSNGSFSFLFPPLFCLTTHIIYYHPNSLRT